MATVNVVRKRSNRVMPAIRFQFDYWLMLAVAGLLVVGMLMVFSTTFDYGILFKNEATYYIERQMWALLLGLLAIIFIMQFDYHALRRISVPFLVITLVALFFLLVFGEAIFGARRGIFEGSYQPSEVAKLATILYIAHWLSTKGDRIKILTYGLLPFSVITGVVCALIVQQPDLSTAALIALVSFTLFFIAGADWRQFGLAGALGGTVFLFLMLTLPHARNRVDDFTIALRDPEQASWHVRQSLIALGRGGWTGVGLGESTQKFGPLPAAHTDGVFAVLGEELGLLGTLLVIGLLAMLVWRGVRAAQRARDSYGFLLALGITSWLAYQALINIAVITAVIPFTGIPLPFLSYGGSSLLFSLIGVGILLNISRDAAMTSRIQPPRRQPAKKQKP
ncbi:MAG: cell division protein FtsW [Ardenticatenaceae bacterium]|nr:cell division protein FtsW [Anaerolineales bacterium]MCB8922316.1 cell division protein FtsW [Ardenticatenaceae bacterium]MCB8990500.1 cell division protein FtsW [Ardenticatenaceae bacterium]